MPKVRATGVARPASDAAKENGPCIGLDTVSTRWPAVGKGAASALMLRVGDLHRGPMHGMAWHKFTGLRLARGGRHPAG